MAVNGRQNWRSGNGTSPLNAISHLNSRQYLRAEIIRIPNDPESWYIIYPPKIVYTRTSIFMSRRKASEAVERLILPFRRFRAPRGWISIVHLFR